MTIAPSYFFSHDARETWTEAWAEVQNSMGNGYHEQERFEEAIASPPPQHSCYAP